MRNPKNILEVSALAPDFMGFIFYEHSQRFVGNDFSIPNEFPQNIKRVGVFVNEDKEVVLQQVQKHKLDFVQLHGDETPSYCAELRKKTKVIKVFPVDEHFDFSRTSSFAHGADYFLFDTKSASYGGSGKTFDWNLLQKYTDDLPFFLSGGLSAVNILKLKDLKIKNLFALDLNSRVELSPGLKDVSKIMDVKNILTSKF